VASIANDPGGRRRILFLDKNGDRKAIWLGKLSKRLAEEIKTKVEDIITAAIAGRSVENETAEWVGKIGDALHAKLATAGLVTPRQPAEPKPQARLADFLENYIAGRTDHKENTRRTIDQARRLLIEQFGADKPIDTITAADATNWQTMLRSRFKPATVSTHVKKAKQMFRHAADAEMIAKNPFAKLKAGKQVDSTRQVFVNRERTQAVIDAAPDAEWRLIIALARYGGLRCPSELLALTWPDVDWERDRFRVDSPKTGERWVPLFPELRPYLAEAFELAPDGSVYIITRYRETNSNLRTQFQRIIRKAGLEPWERLFHNLRSSRQTELTNTFPAHVAAKWLGNSVRVATAHYLQVTEEHFTLAAGNSAPDSALSPKTAQKTAQHGTRTEREPNEKTPEFPGFSSVSPAFSAVSEYPRQESNL